MAEPASPQTDALRKQRWAVEVRARLAALPLTARRQAEIVEELSQHLEDHYRELVDSGASPADAAQLALAEFRSGDRFAAHMSGLRQAQTPRPRVRVGLTVADLWQDLRHAVRACARQPAFAATAAVTLALGIGATTAIFSVVYGVLLRPLPFDEPERLVSIQHRTPLVAIGVNHGPATYLTYRENQSAFEAIGAWDPANVTLTGSGEPDRVQALLVSASTLPLLRVPPIAGRIFAAEDEVPGAPSRVLLTYGYWQRHFGRDPAVGRGVFVDGRPAEVIGVLPASFRFLDLHPAIVLPMTFDPAAPRGISFGFQALARLKSGISLAQANADLARLIGLLPSSFARLELTPNVRPLAADVIGNVGPVLWLLLAAVGIVLLIACGNVANLFLIRTETRQHELALRAALGASRPRLARALFSESVVLAIAGGALGGVLAQLSIRLLRVVAPAELPRLDDIRIDPAVLTFALAVSILSGLVFGLFAVVRFSRPAAGALREGGRSVGDGPSRHRVRHALAVGQIAMALTLLVVSGLMVRTVVAMRRVDPGFTQPAEVQTFVVAVPAGLVADGPHAARTLEQIADRLARVPGVTAVGLSSSVTMDGEDNANPIEIEGVPVIEGQMPPLRRFKSVGPGYVETMGNRFVAGRAVTWTEIHEQRPVIMISEPLAREIWGTPAAALGKRIRASTRDPGGWRDIVGVVAAERDDGLTHPPTAIVYWPILNQTYRWRTMTYVVRSSLVGTAAFLPELKRAVSAVNANLPVANVQTLDAIQAASMAQTSFTLVMLGLAAAVALLIGVVGIYGVIAYVAAQRTREIGIRMALGAQIGDVRRMLLRYGLALALAGIALGVAAAAFLTRVMSTMLFGVSRTDPITYGAVAIVLAVLTLLASYVPARRASRVDPVIALRAS